MRLKGLIFAVVIILAGCNPPADINRNEYKEESRYPQDFRTTAAFLVLEWNGIKTYITASAYLANKEEKTFYTAKHFTDSFEIFGPDYCKVFFNGGVFKARIIKVPPVRDAALVRLVGLSRNDIFPEPLPIAGKRPNVGDKLYVQGFHPHPFPVIKFNRLSGLPDKMVPIFSTYYAQDQRVNRVSEIVFDNLEGTVISSSSSINGVDYIKIQTSRDHLFSFGGLSGGAVLNKSGEVVGIVTAEDLSRFSSGELGMQRIYDTLYITSVDVIGDLIGYAKNLRD